jgi:hypothetical protein
MQFAPAQKLKKAMETHPLGVFPLTFAPISHQLISSGWQNIVTQGNLLLKKAGANS